MKRKGKLIAAVCAESYSKWFRRDERTIRDTAGDEERRDDGDDGDEGI